MVDSQETDESEDDGHKELANESKAAEPPILAEGLTHGAAQFEAAVIPSSASTMADSVELAGRFIGQTTQSRQSESLSQGAGSKDDPGVVINEVDAWSADRGSGEEGEGSDNDRKRDPTEETVLEAELADRVEEVKAIERSQDESLVRQGKMASVWFGVVAFLKSWFLPDDGKPKH